MNDLSTHNALVTGAGRRLGRAFAEAIGQRGAGVIVHYRDSAAQAEHVVEAIRQSGSRAEALQADLTDPESAVELLAAAHERLGPIDLLINNAAVFEPVTALDASLATWQRTLNVNLTAPFMLSQAFARTLDGKPGSIVNLLDWRALRPGADHFPYTISKAALAALTRGLAVALAPNVRVNGLALGAILPPVDGAGGNPLVDVPLQRWGTVEEAVDGLLFLLAGPQTITGEILQLDGGRHLSESDA